jgi:hypothetical protein
MYYKEEVINGVLCWRHRPDGEWIPMDSKAMTARIQRLEKELKYFQDRFTFVVTPE